MKQLKQIIASATALLAMTPMNASAQDNSNVEAYFDADIVSHYMWRGQDKSAAALQPTAYISWQGLTLRLDGSAAFRRDDVNEINLTLGYENFGFNIGVTDYWKTGVDTHNRYFHFENHGPHQIEANIGYSWKYGSLQAYTFLLGNDYRISGKRAYSTYIELSVPFKLGGVDWRVAVGMTPFESAGQMVSSKSANGTTSTTSTTTKKETEYFYAEGVACNMASLRAQKTLNLGFAQVPVFAEFHANPYLQTANFLFGLTLTPF